MLTIRAVSFRGQPLGREVAARFGEAGGTIGRGETNTLVLSDPERFISRTHATISFQAGGFIITDNGTKNPVTLNGRPLGSGSQARLGDRDQIKIGDYLLEVRLAPVSVPTPPPARVEAPPKSPDPFADLLRPAERSGPRTQPIFPLEPAAPKNPEAIPADAFADLRGREPSIDDLIGGIKPSGSSDLLAPELPPGGPLDRAGVAGVVDPLDILAGILRPVPPPSVPDHGPELFTPYSPPAAKPEPVVKAGPEVAPPAPRPSIPPASAPPIQRVSAMPAGSHDEALLRAFLQGAGIPGIQSAKSLTPEMMEAIGKVLREAVQGTLDLLRARGVTKSEMRADVTMIMAQDNNPLKFSPTVEAALTHLLAPQVHGFMPPLRAMKDAYDDLRAHQLGFLAGMRAALEEVLARFGPQELDKRLSAQSMLDDLLPMNRKAKLWDLFIERHAAISAEAREDFNAAFGKAFRRAYEAQVKQLRGERG
jgi:type VI secretion system FHA domain protein